MDSGPGGGEQSCRRRKVEGLRGFWCPNQMPTDHYVPTCWQLGWSNGRPASPQTADIEAEQGLEVSNWRLARISSLPPQLDGPSCGTRRCGDQCLGMLPPSFWDRRWRLTHERWRRGVASSCRPPGRYGGGTPLHGSPVCADPHSHMVLMLNL